MIAHEFGRNARMVQTSGQSENIRQPYGGFGRCRPQSVGVFRHAPPARPDVVSRQVHMQPTEGKQRGQHVVGGVLGLAQSGDGAFQIPRVPQAMPAGARRR